MKRLPEKKPADMSARASKRHPTLRAAWLAFEIDDLDRARELATSHVDADDEFLAADAKKLSALVRFRLRRYSEALALFRQVVEVHDDGENWFNVATAATLGGDIELGQRAFKRALAAQERGDSSGELTVPFMRQYYARALQDRGECRKALEQVEALRPIYEQLKVTDETFLTVRGVPLLSQTMDVAIDVFRELGGSFDWAQWIDALAKRLDNEGREYLLSLKPRIADVAS